MLTNTAIGGFLLPQFPQTTQEQDPSKPAWNGLHFHFPSCMCVLGFGDFLVFSSFCSHGQHFRLSPNLTWLRSLVGGGSEGYKLGGSALFWVGRERKKEENVERLLSFLFPALISQTPFHLSPSPRPVLPSLPWLEPLQSNSLARLLFLWSVGRMIVFWACRDPQVSSSGARELARDAHLRSPFFTRPTEWELLG